MMVIFDDIRYSKPNKWNKEVLRYYG